MEVMIDRLHTAKEILWVLDKFDEAFPRSITSRVGDLDRYAERLRDRAFVYSAEKDGATVGFVAFYANDASSATAFLTHIAVDELFRGMRIGLMLMRVCIKVSAEAAMKQLKLEVDTSNMTAIAFYESLGFLYCGPASPKSGYMILERL